MDNSDAILTNPLSDKKIESFLFILQKRQKTGILREKVLKMFLAHVECSLDNPVKEKLTEEPGCFAQCPKMLSKLFFQNK